MKNILLIGGSTGIGYELSKKLVDNNNVFISTRNTEIFNGTEINSRVLNLDEEFELDCKKLPMHFYLIRDNGK